MRVEADFLVLGSGIAGLSFALKAARLGTVLIVTKANPAEGATRYAQGGIASVFSETDSFESHIQDTLDAGDGLCNQDIVKLTVTEGPARVRELIELGVPFNKRENDTEYDLTREGGHRKRRILHVDDLTGASIEETLLARVKEEKNIHVLDHHIGIDLITTRSRAVKGKLPDSARTRALGAYVLDTRTGDIHVVSAPFTVLATGGAGKVYLYTTNPDVATGDGIAMAFRAGARTANLEFTQFHPTALYHPKAKTFLISEALRGEGGVLVDKNGKSFMERYHEMASLAPRDVVARAIDSEMKRHGHDCVYLDMTKTKHDAEFLKKRFPNIYDLCMRYGIDFTRDPIPVVPAAHYTCGGVWADPNGETTIENLFAVGETASTGLHGANRLASNSLLEGAVFADLAVRKISEKIRSAPSILKQEKSMPAPLPEWDHGRAVEMEERINIHHTWRELRTLMWNYVGIVRTDKRLERAAARLELIQHEVQEYYWTYRLTADLVELRNLVTVASLIVQCAMERKESRGLHYNLDHPGHDDRFFLKDTVL